nr:hypothetical protein [Szabonella alba]
MDRIAERFRGIVRAMTALSRDERGAVTVDWVILTAAIVALGFIVIGSFGVSLRETASQVSDDIATRAVGIEY